MRKFLSLDFESDYDNVSSTSGYSGDCDSEGRHYFSVYIKITAKNDNYVGKINVP